jgi:hypothetical protein
MPRFPGDQNPNLPPRTLAELNRRFKAEIAGQVEVDPRLHDCEAPQPPQTVKPYNGAVIIACPECGQPAWGVRL